MNWDSIVEKITPYVVKIETQDGHGTGFLCFYSEDKQGSTKSRAIGVGADEMDALYRQRDAQTGVTRLGA